VTVVDRAGGARYAAVRMTTDPSTDAVTPPRGGWRGWLARLGFAVQVLIIGAVAIGGIPMFALMVAGAVDEQLLTSTGVRTQAMVIDHGDQEVAVAFQPPGSQRVRAVIGLWEGERPAAYPVEGMVGVVYDPHHPRTVDLDGHLLGIGNLVDRAVTAVMGLLLLLFCLMLVGMGGREAARMLTARRRGRASGRSSDVGGVA
jgi:hypothetical protein